MLILQYAQIYAQIQSFGSFRVGFLLFKPLTPLLERMLVLLVPVQFI